MMVPANARIVITGGPGSGKTEFFERLKTEGRLAGFLFFEELARQILTENPQIRHDQSALHREIFSRQIEREKAAGARSFVTDRGTVDAFAFHPETMVDVGTTLENEYQRYTAVIQLGSAAALGQSHYRQDEVRKENIAEALQIETALRRVWSGHASYAFVPANESLEEKYGEFRQIIVKDVEG